MTLSQVNSGSALSKNNFFHPQTAVTSEQAVAFEASVGGPSETTGDNLEEGQKDSSLPTASWDAFWKGFDHAIFDHSRREFAYYDQKRKEIDDKP